MAKRKMLKTCPECGGEALSTQWCGNRRLQQYCTDGRAGGDCWWKGPPYTPPRRRIQTTKAVYTDFGAWTYEMFDQYGYTATSSQAYGSEAACRRAALEDIKRMSTAEGYGQCVAIIWPPKVMMKGKLVRAPKKRKK